MVTGISERRNRAQISIRLKIAEAVRFPSHSLRITMLTMFAWLTSHLTFIVFNNPAKQDY